MQRLKQILMTAIGNINIIPQDIGRVILNLINNAFYAVKEKQKQDLAEGMNQPLQSAQRKLKTQLKSR